MRAWMLMLAMVVVGCGGAVDVSADGAGTAAPDHCDGISAGFPASEQPDPCLVLVCDADGATSETFPPTGSPCGPGGEDSCSQGVCHDIE